MTDKELHCINCDGTSFEIKESTFKIEINQAEVKVKTHAYTCNDCGYRVMDQEQMSNLLQLAKEEYKKLTQ